MADNWDRCAFMEALKAVHQCIVAAINDEAVLSKAIKNAKKEIIE